MNPLDVALVRQYVNDNIGEFHQRRVASLEQLSLNRLLQKNPYLFRAKAIETAGDLMTGLLDAFLSSSEEKLFGDFLEQLAIFIAEQTCGGHKSSSQGVDLEFIRDHTHFIISIKSGPNWGNSSQHRRLAQDLRDAVTRVKQGRSQLQIQPVLGICYGKTRTTHTSAGYLKVVGQNFWSLISGDTELYTSIIEPLGYQAKERNEQFNSERAHIINRFTGEFIQRFCYESGAIDWQKLVEFNSKNYDLDQFI